MYQVSQPQVSRSSRRKQRRGGPTRNKINSSRRSGLGHQESPNVAKTPNVRTRTTSQEGQAIDPLRHSKDVALEKPNGSASPGTGVVQGHARQETAQRTSAATQVDITGSHVTIAARSSLGSVGTSRTLRIRRDKRPRGRASASEQKRSQRSSSQRVDRPGRGTSAVCGTIARRYRGQPSHTPAVFMARE